MKNVIDRNPFFNLARTISIQSIACCLILLLVGGGARQAWSFAYVIDDVGINWGLYPFGRVLWNAPIVADPADPTKNIMILRYAFQPKAPAVNFKWETNTGAVVNKKNKDFTQVQKNAINRAASTWVKGTGSVGNLRGRNLNNGYDLESTALHELGHALGIGHPNADGTTTWNKTTGVASHTPANENVNVAGKPGTFPVPIADKTNLQKTNTIQAVDIFRPVPQGIGGTEAAMIQGVFPNEIQRLLSYDDQQALSGLNSGVDFLQGTADDFRILLKEVAWDQQHEINIFNLDLAGAEGLTNWAFNPLQNPKGLNFSKVFLDQAFDSDGGLSQIALSDLLFTEDYGQTSNSQIGFANIYLDADVMVVSEPATVSIFAAGVFALVSSRRRIFAALDIPMIPRLGEP